MVVTKGIMGSVLLDDLVEVAVDNDKVHFSGIDQLAFVIEHEAFNRPVFMPPFPAQRFPGHAADDSDAATDRADVDLVGTGSYSRHTVVHQMVWGRHIDDGVIGCRLRPVLAFDFSVHGNYF